MVFIVTADALFLEVQLLSFLVPCKVLHVPWLSEVFATTSLLDIVSLNYEYTTFNGIHHNETAGESCIMTPRTQEIDCTLVLGSVILREDVEERNLLNVATSRILWNSRDIQDS